MIRGDHAGGGHGCDEVAWLEGLEGARAKLHSRSAGLSGNVPARVTIRASRKRGERLDIDKAPGRAVTTGRCSNCKTAPITLLRWTCQGRYRPASSSMRDRLFATRIVSRRYRCQLEELPSPRLLMTAWATATNRNRTRPPTFIIPGDDAHRYKPLRSRCSLSTRQQYQHREADQWPKFLGSG
jgi:hypothetical protein